MSISSNRPCYGYIHADPVGPDTRTLRSAASFVLCLIFRIDLVRPTILQLLDSTVFLDVTGNLYSFLVVRSRFNAAITKLEKLEPYRLSFEIIDNSVVNEKVSIVNEKVSINNGVVTFNTINISNPSAIVVTMTEQRETHEYAYVFKIVNKFMTFATVQIIRGANPAFEFNPEKDKFALNGLMSRKMILNDSFLDRTASGETNGRIALNETNKITTNDMNEIVPNTTHISNINQELNSTPIVRIITNIRNNTFTLVTNGLPIIVIALINSGQFKNYGEVLYTIDDNVPYGECKPEIISISPAIYRSQLSIFPQINPVVNGVGCTLFQKYSSIIACHGFSIPLPIFSDKMAQYALSKYILARLLYGFFSLKFLTRCYNKKFFHDLAASRFSPFIAIFTDTSFGLIGFERFFVDEYRC